MKTVLTRIALIGLMSLLFFGACSKDDETKPRKIELTFPGDWDVTYDVNEYIAVQGVSPLESGSDIFLENMNAAFENVPGYSLQAYYDGIVVALSAESVLGDFNILYESDTTLNSYSAKKLIFTATIQDIPIKFLDYILYENGFGFIITCTAEEASYNRFESIFDGIAGTVKIN